MSDKKPEELQKTQKKAMNTRRKAKEPTLLAKALQKNLKRRKVASETRS